MRFAESVKVGYVLQASRDKRIYPGNNEHAGQAVYTGAVLRSAQDDEMLERERIQGWKRASQEIA